MTANHVQIHYQAAMPSSKLLPSLLRSALEVLEKRFEILAVPASKIALSAWDQLPPSTRELVPTWYKHLLATYCVAGGVLEYRGKGKDPLRLFSFFRPDDLAIVLSEDSLMRPLVDYGYFPVANESDGNAWLCSQTGGPDSDVQLLELTCWDQGEPSKYNGLVFAASSLSYLLASMGVSEASYYSKDTGPSRVIWYHE